MTGYSIYRLKVLDFSIKAAEIFELFIKWQLHIWRYSKKIQHENILFDQAQLIKNVVRSLIAGKSMDDRLKSCSRIDNLEALCNAASFVQNVFSQTLMVNNNGR